MLKIFSIALLLVMTLTTYWNEVLSWDRNCPPIMLCNENCTNQRRSFNTIQEAYDYIVPESDQRFIRLLSGDIEGFWFNNQYYYPGSLNAGGTVYKNVYLMGGFPDCSFYQQGAGSTSSWKGSLNVSNGIITGLGIVLRNQ